MASFNETLRESTRLLAGFNNVLRNAGGGGGFGGGSAAAGVIGGLAGGRAALAAGGPLGLALAGAGLAAGAVNGAATFLGPGARAFAATGSSSALAAGVTAGLLDTIGSNPIGALLTADLQVARGTAQRAGASVADTTTDLARIGVNVSDRQRRALFGVAAEQERRVTEERARVEAIANSAAALEGVKPAGASDSFSEVVAVLRSIENKITNVTGGRN